MVCENNIIIKNEVKYKMKTIKKRVNAHLYVTAKCNLNCKHCYSANNRGLKSEISLEEMIWFVQNICTNYDAYIDVEGGELFLRNEMLSFFQALTKSERERITITTNGTIYTNIPSTLFKELCEFRVSIEGHNDRLHKKMRGVPLEPILENCKKWICEDVPIVARVTLNKSNFEYINNIVERLLSVGIKRFSFYEFQAVGRGEVYYKDFQLSNFEMKKAINSLSDAILLYPKIENIKVHLSKARTKMLNNINISRFKIEDLSRIPTITLNHDGYIGICPWNICSQYRLDITNSYPMFFINEIISEQAERHECQYCSELRLLYDR